ncbi:uncharacterized protein RAG0_14945 [Rhynchosporium agropyri]|uniref:Uncharacterized protein n=1 Tax=Rhynchosporium agropyri TaxID=914238 RepID=A0A1E1LJ06_9HELO|nr:uncharacterized protein RAG0_14945 [Rhynchosporium agropyri]
MSRMKHWSIFMIDTCRQTSKQKSEKIILPRIATEVHSDFDIFRSKLPVIPKLWELANAKSIILRNKTYENAHNQVNRPSLLICLILRRQKENLPSVSINHNPIPDVKRALNPFAISIKGIAADMKEGCVLSLVPFPQRPWR